MAGAGGDNHRDCNGVTLRDNEPNVREVDRKVDLESNPLRSRRSPECEAYPQGTTRVVLTVGLFVLAGLQTVRVGLTAGLLHLLRTKGHMPCMVRRVRSLPAGYYARTRLYTQLISSFSGSLY